MIHVHMSSGALAFPIEEPQADSRAQHLRNVTAGIVVVVLAVQAVEILPERLAHPARSDDGTMRYVLSASGFMDVIDLTTGKTTDSRTHVDERFYEWTAAAADQEQAIGRYRPRGDPAVKIYDVIPVSSRASHVTVHRASSK